MTAKNLAIVKPEEQKPKAKRERIALIETPPKPDWFVKTRERGRTVWYLRFIVTGMLPRRFGPFPSRHRTLLALDAMLWSAGMADGICSLPDTVNPYLLKRQFQAQQNWGPVIEDDLALANGRG